MPGAPQEASRAHHGAGLEERVAQCLRALPAANRRLALGLSGGMDSAVALHLLARLREDLAFRLSAVHVNHGLSPQAAEWADFCRGLCEASHVPFTVVAVEVPRRPGESLEARAREVRHAVFAAQDADYVVLAHHADDQAETLLYRLLRGAGVKGMGAMRTVRGPGEGVSPGLLRPLLSVSGRELAAYAAEHGLRWVEDEANADLAFDRNFLRHRVLPMVATRFASYARTLGRASRNFAEASALLDDLARLDGGPGLADRLPVERLQALSWTRAKNLLRFFLESAGVRCPGARRLEEALRQVLTAGADAQVCVDLGDTFLRRYRGTLYVTGEASVPDTGLRLPWDGRSVLELPRDCGRLASVETCGQGLILERLRRDTLTVGFRRGGEKFRTDARRPLRALKHLWQDAAIPPWVRPRMPLLYCGDTLVWAAGLGVAPGWEASTGITGLVIDWRAAGAPASWPSRAALRGEDARKT
ncbi:MAG: tRNA lysidine(34) synthetase TilS [Betaproteobacteria bacterium]|nr:tRNA lysidine(34) synthetase TilS [Betaproteobacteria bacterium]